MIAIEHQAAGIFVTVAGDFTLADYKEFEQSVIYALKFQGKPQLLFDLRSMLGYTLDVVWEELRFTRAHRNDFARVAVVTTDQWTSWATWLAKLYVEAQVQLFDDADLAQQWLEDMVADQC